MKNELDNLLKDYIDVKYQLSVLTKREKELKEEIDSSVGHKTTTYKNYTIKFYPRTMFSTTMLRENEPEVYEQLWNKYHTTTDCMKITK